MTLKRTHQHGTRPLSSNATETIQIPVFDRIQDICLRFDGTEAQMRSEIGNIRLTVNGTDIINASATEILDVYEYLGVNVDESAGIDGVMSLNVGRLLYKNPNIRDQFGWGEVGVTNIQVSVTAGTLSNISEVQAFSWRDKPRDADGRVTKQEFGAHVRLIGTTISDNIVGESTVDTLPRDLGTAYLAVLMSDGASGAISSGRCSVNNVNVYEDTPSDVAELFASQSGFSVPSGYYAYNFSDGGLNSRLPMDGVTDLRFVTTFGTGAGAGGYRALQLLAVDFPRNIPT